MTLIHLLSNITFGVAVKCWLCIPFHRRTREENRVNKNFSIDDLPLQITHSHISVKVTHGNWIHYSVTTCVRWYISLTVTLALVFATKRKMSRVALEVSRPEVDWAGTVSARNQIIHVRSEVKATVTMLNAWLQQDNINFTGHANIYIGEIYFLNESYASRYIVSYFVKYAIYLLHPCTTPIPVRKFG
jgi:hypothetical protein